MVSLPQETLKSIYLIPCFWPLVVALKKIERKPDLFVKMPKLPPDDEEFIFNIGEVAL